MAFRFIFFIILLFAAPLFPQESEPKTQAQIYFEEGLHTADLSEKIRLFEKTLHINPRHQPALYRLGITYYRTGNYLKTVETLSKVYEIEDSEKQNLQLYLRNAFALLAKDLIKQEKYDSAQNAARDALDITPDYSPALTALGIAQFFAGDYKDAIASLNKSIALDSLQEEAWNKLGDAYLRTKSYPDAIFAYQKALSLNPNLQKANFHLDIARKRCTPEFLLNKANVLNAEYGRDQAIHILKQGKKLYPENVEISGELASLQREEIYEKSLEAIDEQNWQTALNLLSQLPGDYQNTPILLEEVNTKLSPPEPDPKPEILKRDGEDVSPAKTAIADNQIKGITEPEDEPVTEKIARPQTVSEAMPDVGPSPDTTAAPVTKDSLQLASTDAIIIQQDSTAKPGQSQPPVEASREVVAAPSVQDSDNSGFWYGLTFGVAAMGLLAFVSIKNRQFLRQKQQLLFKKFASLKSGGRTDDLLQVASDTPVKFGNIGTSDLLEQTSKDATGHPDENLLHLMETKTIVGGLKKMLRIGRYVIEKEIGRGSMGLVYKAWDPKLERTVVIKQVKFDKERFVEQSRLHDRLLNEARAAGKLNHPNIVVIYDVEQDKDFSYIVMEYVEGYDLKSVLNKQINLKAERAIHITKQICSALAFAHENDIIHRDIKPSNIILANKDVVKVADFGIAKLPQFETLTQTDDIVGTPFYMSPEQIEGRKVDGRSDVFSTGVVLYEMLTGNRPFQGDNIPSIVYKIVHKRPKAPSHKYKFIPKQFDEVVKKALAKEPQQRYQSAAEFAQALDAVLESIRNEV